LLVTHAKTRPFTPFRFTVDVDSKDELVALTQAAGRMCNGHNQLYDFLKAMCDEIDPDMMKGWG
jgi:hypothetical protein